jgi:hypothetical protein
MKEKAKFIVWRYLVGLFVFCGGIGIFCEGLPKAVVPNNFANGALSRFIPPPSYDIVSITGGIIMIIVGFICFVWSPNCLDDK